MTVDCPVCKTAVTSPYTCGDCQRDLSVLAFLKDRAGRAYDLGKSLAAAGADENAAEVLRMALCDYADHEPARALLTEIERRLADPAPARTRVPPGRRERRSKSRSRRRR